MVRRHHALLIPLMALGTPALAEAATGLAARPIAPADTIAACL